MPLILILNMGCFVIANINVGVDVRFKISSGNVVHENWKLKSFNLVNSVRDMWNAKVYPLSILIALFSGIWPYTKLILMICCWIIP